MNLLHETVEILEGNGKGIKDILWVGSLHGRCSIEHFIKFANVEYDNGYGSQKVASNLLIVGEDFWLERHEYDGSECWYFKKIPTKPDIEVEYIGFIRGRWNTLEQVQKLNTKERE